ncbi:hypothetical protein [Serratia proteamaculans]|uniref:hypothetical protein n=1 Tax=Serratia proteamaculans TaxID=28151 RepID=UPI00217BC1C6|nr:hypothetical protein [Serratia proteamaculans]CAI1758648.1 Uncharacterised protein [Serratia proteamaculans]
MSQPVILPFDDFPIDNPLINDMKSLLKSEFAYRVKRVPTGPAGMCYWNAEDNATQHGGNVSMGWMIEWVPGLFIQAMDHAVFVTKDGDMTDVTAVQIPRKTDTGFTTFIPNQERKFPVGFELTPHNCFLPLCDDPLVEDSIKLYHDNFTAHNKRVMALMASGHFTFNRGQLAGNPRAVGGAFANEYNKHNAIVTDTSSKRNAVNARLMKKYFPQH